MDVNFQAAIFDTRTADLHAAAWKALFDEFLQRHATEGQPLRPFDANEEYRAYVDGRPRREGIRSFLAERGITASEQEQEALAQRKNALFEERLSQQGVAVFASTLDLIKSLRAAGVKTAVVSSSRHGREILRRAGVEAQFDAQLDGVVLAKRGLANKPAPDMFIEAARQLGAAPGRALVVEDAVAGVRAGRRDEALTWADILGSSEAFRKAMDYYTHGRDQGALLEKLAALQPQVLACMHGSAYCGEGVAMLSRLSASLAD